ncbi:MAG: dihydroorotate dehydrogenase electron transfer subunit [Candidatus Zixiibacteriota bacterium]
MKIAISIRLGSNIRDMIFQFASAVISKQKLKKDIFKLTLHSPFISQTAKPGNFVHIKVSSNYYPLLRRAFSVHSVDKQKRSFDILFKVVGRGTRILSEKSPGDILDLLGPIGNNFSPPRKGERVMLVAGGMGIAPLWFLFTNLIKKIGKERSIFLLGAKTKNELPYCEKTKDLGTNLIVTTDNGGFGTKGLVTEVFLQEIQKRKNESRKPMVYSCGPPEMLKKMSEISKEYDLSCQISLEGSMACGVGACWGCAVKLEKGGYKRVCADGPVFDAREVIIPSP